MHTDIFVNRDIKSLQDAYEKVLRQWQREYFRVYGPIPGLPDLVNVPSLNKLQRLEEKRNHALNELLDAKYRKGDII